MEAERLRLEAQDAATKTALPESVDADAISRLLAEVFLQGWMSMVILSDTNG